MTRQELLSKKNLLVGGVILVVVVLALVYFLVVPSQQVSSYKKNVNAKQSQLRDKVSKVSDFLSSSAFTGSDTADTEVTAEIKKTRDAIKDAESTLSSDKSALTSFKAMPLLDWNSKYKTAKEISSNEQKYIANTESYFKDLKGVLDYMEKQIEAASSLTNFESDLTVAGDTAQTLPEYGAAIEPAIKKVQEAYDKYKTLNPPAILKEIYDYDLKSTEELLGLMNQLMVAAKADDTTQFLTVAAQQAEKANEVIAKSAELQKKFVNEGSLAKTNDSLKELARTIETNVGKL